MQAVQMRRPGIATLLLLVTFVITGCGQKGPLYREAPSDVVAPPAAAPAQHADDDGRESE